MLKKKTSKKKIGKKKTAKKNNTFTISQLSTEFSITTRTIRYYEDEGLLSPKREGRNRIYSRKDRGRLKIILRGKRLGFSLDEILEIINLYDSNNGSSTQLNKFIEKINQHIASLEHQQKDIQETIHELYAHKQNCIKLIVEKKNIKR